MPDPIALVPAVAPVPVPIAAPTVSPGWKTTEAYLSLIAMGALTYGLEELLTIVKSLATNPLMPPWVTAIAAIAPIGLGFLIKLTAKNYGQQRLDLKLGVADAASGTFDLAGAIAEGMSAVKLPAGAQADKLNQ